MLNQRHHAAQAVAKELLPAEQHLDDAIIRNARLTIAVIEGRKSARVSLTVGQEGLDLVAQAQARLIEARGIMAQAHSSFRAAQSEIGLNAFAYGDIQECPDPKGQEDRPPLVAVA